MKALSALLCLLALHACAAEPSRPGPFVFVHGLQGRGAAETAPALGCNTIYFDLPADAPLMLPAIRGWIAEAHAADLSVIVGLRTCLGGDYSVTPTDAEYCAALGEWIEAVVGSLKDEPGVVGWATDHDLERAIRFTDRGFRDWLMRQHGTLGALSTFWGVDYGSLVEVDRNDVEGIDAEQPFGVGRASVDLAEYRRSVFHDLMKMWAGEIRAHGGEGLLFTGRIARYRGLTAVPDDYDVVMPFVSPDVLERDAVSHNVQGVQIARRGGRFEVIPWLRVPLPPSVAARDGLLASWIMEAGLRGAIGVCLSDWSRIGSSHRVLADVSEQLWTVMSQGAFLPQPPTPTAAVLYEPYAGGSKEMGTPYGYLPRFDYSDVSALAWQYRLGTVFGGLDYLCVEDLAGADLDRYGVIFAPLCLRMPEAAAEAVRSYLRRGGALFADIGLGMYEAGTWAPHLGPLAPELGLLRSMPIETRFGSFSVGHTHPHLPSVRRGMQADGVYVLGRSTDISGGTASGHTFTGPASDMKGYPFQGPSCFVGLSGGAIPLATMSVRFDEEANPHFLGLLAGDAGAGLAVFGSFPVWTYWSVQDGLHAALHLDLLRRKARRRLISGGLLPGALRISGSRDQVHLLNRGGATAVQVLSADADHRVWLGAICVFSAAEVDASGRRTGVVRLDAEVADGALLHIEAIPVRLRPYTGECCARLSCHSPGLIAMHVGGQGSVWRKRRGQSPSFDGDVATRVRFGVEDGLYVVAPDSKHRVTWREGRDDPRSTDVTADYRGCLDFALTLTGAEVWIQPL